ncbi:MAG: hypothetical protein QXR06_04380 [Candidatus Bathyarchaeia archaeon]
MMGWVSKRSAAEAVWHPLNMRLGLFDVANSVNASGSLSPFCAG